jgi:hypothetical protein
MHAADFFVADEHEADVVGGACEIFHEGHHDSNATFHVDRSATVETFAIVAGDELFVVSVYDV